MLRSHESKIKQVLFMDSLHGHSTIRDGEEAYEEDVRRLRAYTDMKNACLYSFNVGVRFGKPNDEIPCSFYAKFRVLAEGRLNAFRAMYVEPIRRSGGLEAFLGALGSPRG